MAQPPLQLEESYFDIVELEAPADYVPDPEESRAPMEPS